jgi:terminase small subunit / prophage DNA-packing protein
MTLNRDKLAAMLGCDVRMVDDYIRQGMPGDSPKYKGDQWRFDTAAVIGWLRERERTSALGEVAKIDEGDARRRKLAAEAKLVELELAKAEGQAVGLATFSAAMSGMIGAARAKLLGLGSALGPEIAAVADPAECQVLIDAAVSEALQELSEHGGNEIPDEPGGIGESESGDAPVGGAMGAPAKPDRKRVGRPRKKAKQGNKRKAR